MSDSSSIKLVRFKSPLIDEVYQAASASSGNSPPARRATDPEEPDLDELIEILQRCRLRTPNITVLTDRASPMDDTDDRGERTRDSRQSSVQRWRHRCSETTQLDPNEGLRSSIMANARKRAAEVWQRLWKGLTLPYVEYRRWNGRSERRKGKTAILIPPSG